MKTVTYPGATADLDALGYPLQERRVLVAEARRVLLGTLQRLGTALPDQDAQAPDKAAADRLRELREWCASPCAASGLASWSSCCLAFPHCSELHQLASLSDLRDPPSEGCPCRDLRVTVPLDAHATRRRDGGDSCVLCGGWGAPYYLPGDACIGPDEQRPTPSPPGKACPMS